MRCPLILPVLGLLLVPAACDGPGPLAPAAVRADAARARQLPRLPRPDTLIITLPVEPIVDGPVASAR